MVGESSRHETKTVLLVSPQSNGMTQPRQ